MKGMNSATVSADHARMEADKEARQAYAALDDAARSIVKIAVHNAHDKQSNRFARDLAARHGIKSRDIVHLREIVYQGLQ
jgi:hypothetical protein